MNGFGLLSPWGLLGLGALAAVLGIYLFYQRFRERRVTGLFLWDEPFLATRGGRRLTPPRATRSLFLDLLAAALAALALAGPAWSARQGYTLAVVLDESLSMRAGGNDARARAEAAALFDNHAGRAILVSAASTPRLLADSGRAPSGRAGQEALERWEPFAPACDLAEAARLCRELASGRLVIHVFTDHAEPFLAPAFTEIRSHRFRARAGNVALTDAERRRSRETNEDQLFACVANLSDTEQTVRAELRAGARLLGTESLQLTAGESEPLLFSLPAGTAEAEVRLFADEDALADDSAAQLLSEPSAVVSARAALDNSEAQEHARRALRSAGAVESTGAPDLLLTSSAEGRGELYTLRLLSPGTEATVLAGPWVMDMASPFCRDLQLDGIYWPCRSSWRPGEEWSLALVSCGPVPLLVYDNRSLLTLNLDLAKSNMIRSPAWPVLVANLVRAAEELLPGLRRANYKPGELVRFNPFSDPLRNPDRLEGPEGAEAWGERAAPKSLPAPPGAYELRRGAELVAELRVNAIAPAESDLRWLAGEDGTDIVSGAGEGESIFRITPLHGLCLLLALLLAALNWQLDRREG